MDKRSNLPSGPGRARQRGVALIIGMIILVVLALLGASAYSVATQDERIAGNARDHARAMDAAESMLRDCEHYVQNTVGLAFDATGGTGGMFLAPTGGQPWLGDNPAAWTGSTYVLPPPKLAAARSGGSQWSQTPQCIAEEFDLVSTGQVIAPAGLPRTTPSLRAARITARGYGLNSNTVVTLVSTVAFM